MARKAFYAIADKGTGDSKELPFQKPNGEVVLIDFLTREITISGKNYLQSMTRDITEHKRIEEKNKKAKRALTVIGRANEAFTRSKEELQLLNEVCRLIVEDGVYRLAWIALAGQDKAKTVQPVAQWGCEKDYLDTVRQLNDSQYV